jgi:hypothetical protein
MVEYSIIAHAILIGGTLLLLPMVTKVFDAMTTFYNSVYAVLQSAVL